MLFLILILLAGGVALLRGGSLRNVTNRPWPFRWVWLVWLGLALQIALFPPFRTTPLLPVAPTILYPISMFILVGWVALNWRIPGMLVIGLGLVSNTLAIICNGGLMPTTREAVSAVGNVADHVLINGRYVLHNSVLLPDDQIWLRPLTDIFVLPGGTPFTPGGVPQIFSIGDVLIAAGICLLVYSILRPPMAQQQPQEVRL